MWSVVGMDRNDDLYIKKSLCKYMLKNSNTNTLFMVFLKTRKNKLFLHAFFYQKTNQCQTIQKKEQMSMS